MGPVEGHRSDGGIPSENRDAVLMEHARAYIARGWQLFVIPASADGTAKIPAANCDACNAATGVHDREACACLLCHGFYAATDDPDRIAAMLERCPGGSLALRTGAASGVVVLDAEGHADSPGQVTGVEVIDGWEDYAPGTELNPTAVARSASGGIHLFYATGTAFVRSMNRVLPGVDLKANGGYVVLPPGAWGERMWLPPRDGSPVPALGAPDPAEPSPALTVWLTATRVTRAGRLRGEHGNPGDAWVPDDKGRVLPGGYDFARFLAEGPPPGVQRTFLNEWLFRAVRFDGVDNEEALFALAWPRVSAWTQDDRRPWTQRDVRRMARDVLSEVEPAAPVPAWTPHRAYPGHTYRAAMQEDGTVVESIVDDVSGVERVLAPGEMGGHGFRAGNGNGNGNGTTRRGSDAASWIEAPAAREDAARAIRDAEEAARAARHTAPEEDAGVSVPEAAQRPAQEPAQESREDAHGVGGSLATVTPIRRVEEGPEEDAGASYADDEGDGAEGDDTDPIIPRAALDVSGRGGFRGVGYDGADGTHDGQPGSEGMHDTGNANRFARLFGDRTRWIESETSWLVWDAARWMRDRTKVVKGWSVYVTSDVDRYRRRLLDDGDDKEAERWEKFMGRMGDNARRDAMLSCLKAVPGISVTSEQLDTNGMQLVVTNGVVNLETGALEEGRPEDMNTLSAAVAFDADATCPRWEAHIERITCGDRELAAYLQRAAGYTLMGDSSAQAYYSLEGVGNNGKNVFIDTLADIMGEYAARASTKLITQGDKSHMAIVADLAGKRMVFVDEVPQGRILDAERVKMLVGDTPIKAQFMARDWFQFQPLMTLWMAGNGEPTIKDTSNGIWRRMRRIRFEAEIPASERIPGFHRILVREEGSGILNWALAGLADYRARGGDLGVPASVRSAVVELQEDSDHVLAFTESCCEFTGERRGVGVEGDWHTTEDLYAVYKAWCDGNGVAKGDLLTGAQLVRRMVGMGAVRFNDRRTGNRRQRGLEGVRLTTTALGLWSSVLGSGTRS